MGWMNSSAEYSQVSDDHYYYVRKKDKNLYTLYRDKGEDVGDFNIPEGYQFRGCGRYNDQFYVFIMPEENLEGYKLAVVDFSLNKTKDLGIFPGMLPNMIFYHDKAYGYARLYLDEGALLEVRDMMTGNRLDSVLQEKGVYIQELSEYSYPLYYLDIEGEKIEAIYGKSNLKAS